MHENSNVEKRLRIPKILRTLYSPSKVFKELAENPSYRGVVLILILFVASNTLAHYMFYTKHFIQKVKPDLFEEGSDIWTENATLWESNGNCTQNSDKVYGEYSIAFSITNTNELYMQIFFPESINCSKEEFNQTSFSLKLVNGDTAPSNISLTLFSKSSGYFVRNLKEETSNITDWNNWNNLTVSLGGEGWEPKGNGTASWDDINGTKILVEFPKNVNATLLLDAFFFRGQYEPLINYFTVFAFQYSMLYFIFFVMLWIIFGGLLYILSKYAGSELTWKHDLVVSGYSLAPLFIQGLCWTILFMFLPQVKIAMGTVADTLAAGTLILDVATYLQFVFMAWGIIISTFAIRTLNNFTTGKSAAISLASYLTAFFIVRLLGF